MNPFESDVQGLPDPALNLPIGGDLIELAALTAHHRPIDLDPERRHAEEVHFARHGTSLPCAGYPFSAFPTDWTAQRALQGKQEVTDFRDRVN